MGLMSSSTSCNNCLMETMTVAGVEVSGSSPMEEDGALEAPATAASDLVRAHGPMDEDGALEAPATAASDLVRTHHPMEDDVLEGCTGDEDGVGKAAPPSNPGGTAGIREREKRPKASHANFP